MVLAHSAVLCGTLHAKCQGKSLKGLMRTRPRRIPRLEARYTRPETVKGCPDTDGPVRSLPQRQDQCWDYSWQ